MGLVNNHLVFFLFHEAVSVYLERGTMVPLKEHYEMPETEVVETSSSLRLGRSLAQ